MRRIDPRRASRSCCRTRGDAAARGRSRVGAGARRLRRAVGRPRRRQDHVRARADPPSRRRRRRSKCRARPSRWCRPTSCRDSRWCTPTSIACRNRANSPSSASTMLPRTRCVLHGMAGPRARSLLPADRLEIAFTLGAEARAESPRRARSPATALSRRASHAGRAPALPRGGLWRRRSASACAGDASTPLL